MYYPDQRYVSPLTVIRRRCMLPEQAIGTVRVKEGARVDSHEVVANGVIPARYYILDAARFFKLRKPEALGDLLFVDVGDVVQEKDVLAGKKQNRGKRLFSPVRGMVIAIERGRIILQATPDVIDVEAGVRGRVVRVFPDRGVEVETTGARVQGVWGNNRSALAVLQMAPEDGLETLPEESLGMRHSGTALVINGPLTRKALTKAAQRGISGIIAPSMDAALLDPALRCAFPILLTEGFGNIRMSHNVYTLLEEFAGNQIILDAHQPDRWATRAPEVIIGVAPKEGEIPSRPNVMLALREGVSVRITRAPHAGLTGTVVYLPKSPVLLENGLRIQCAQVELVVGETVFVPLADVEVLGR